MAIQADLLRESFAVAAEEEGALTSRFYELLFERYPQVKPLFSRNEPAAQQKMLQETLVAALEHLEDGAWLQETLGNMGQVHLSYEVTEDMYPYVGECLIAALAETVGDAWTPAHTDAWSEVYGVLSGLMIQGAKTTA